MVVYSFCFPLKKKDITKYHNIEIFYDEAGRWLCIVVVLYFWMSRLQFQSTRIENREDRRDERKI